MENERRVQQKTPAGRYALLDELRGLDLVSMMLYHACWDLVFLFDVNMRWYAGTPGRLWQQTKYITLPALKPIIVMMFILNVGHIFYSDFGLFYQVTQGVPNSLYNVASTFDTYVYQALQSNVTIGRTAAAGLFQAACCCATVLVANFIVSKIDEESAII